MEHTEVLQELNALKVLLGQQQQYINAIHEQLARDSTAIVNVVNGLRDFAEVDNLLKGNLDSIKDEVCSITFLMFYALLHILQRDEDLRQTLHKAAAKDLHKKGTTYPYVIRGLRQLLEFSKAPPVVEVKKTPVANARKTLNWTPQVIRGGKESEGE